MCIHITSISVFAQLPFSFHRNYLQEETFCVQLAEIPAASADDIDGMVSGFGENPVTAHETPVFRVIDYGDPRKIRDIIIRKIEKKDTLCLVTLKLIKNHRRSEVFVHRKTYGLEKWNAFEELAKKYFHFGSGMTNMKTFRHEGSHEKYEYFDGTDYRALSGTDSGSDIIWLRDYLEYLLSPIFVEHCPEK